MQLLPFTYLASHFDVSSHDPKGLLHAYEWSVMKEVMMALHRFYPGYDWKVACNAHPKVGIVSIKLPRIHHSTLGWNFPIEKLANDPGLLIVKKGAGELLERFKLQRKKANKAEYTDLIRSKRVFSIKDHIDGGRAYDNRARYEHPTQRLILPSPPPPAKLMVPR
jgi:hypothetical protein